MPQSPANPPTDPGVTAPPPLLLAGIAPEEFERVVRRMGEGVVGLDGDLRIALCNPAAAAMLHLSDTQLLGRSFERVVPHGELQVLVRSLASASVTRDLGSQRVAVQVAGEDRLLHVALHTVIAEPGFRIRYLLYLTDNTEVARSARMKADFVANASHELRTPLSTIKAASETLLESAVPLEAHHKRFLEVITKNVQRLEELARDLLELTRVESPRLKIRLEAVNLDTLIAEIVPDFEDKLATRAITFTADLRLRELRADRKLLKLVLSNLIDNAVKFTRPPAGTIRIFSRRTADGPCVAVQDSGIGIGPAEQERIFERFYQVDSARKESAEPGTGLGLSIVKHATAAMGARVELDSVLGEGTTVRVIFPHDHRESASYGTATVPPDHCA